MVVGGGGRMGGTGAAAGEAERGQWTLVLQLQFVCWINLP